MATSNAPTTSSSTKTATPSNKKSETGIQARATESFETAKGAVGEAVKTGLNTVQDQIQTIREHGVEGIKKDVRGYVKREPLKALLLAGGIGALTALILRR